MIQCQCHDLSTQLTKEKLLWERIQDRRLWPCFAIKFSLRCNTHKPSKVIWTLPRQTISFHIFKGCLSATTWLILKGNLTFVIAAIMWKSIMWGTFKWDEVFKNRPSKISGQQHLKNMKWYGLLRQTISLQIFKGCLPQIFLGPFFNILTQILVKTFA